MNAKLLLQACSKLLAGLLLIGIFLFLPAGTFAFWNAWLFVGLLFVPMLMLGVVLFIKAPELLKKRLNSKEKENEQKKVIGMSLVAFVIFLFYPILIVKRISNEEKVLEQGLEGYAEYKKRVKYRLIPFVY